MADLDPVADGERGLGFRPRYDARAAGAGATPDEIRAEEAEVQPKRPKPEPHAAPEQDALPSTETKQQDRPAEIAKATAEALAAVREPLRPGPDGQAGVSPSTTTVSAVPCVSSVPTVPGVWQGGRGQLEEVR